MLFVHSFRAELAHLFGEIHSVAQSASDISCSRLLKMKEKLY